MSKVKELDFDGQTLFCGIDVHKKSWRINIRTEEFELEDYSQDPSSELLISRLKKRYPGATYRLAYEAGFCGFGIQRSMEKAGLHCLVVNPADIPSTDKEKKRKTDGIDARKISRQLAAEVLHSIYIPTVEMEHVRTLIRQRSRLVKDQTRCKNRIWHLLMFSDLKLEGYSTEQYWSSRFVESLRQVPCLTQSLRLAFHAAIEEFVLVRKLVSTVTKEIRQLSREAFFKETVALLQSIPGIGTVNAMIIFAELQDIKRFKTLDRLCSYAGLVPDTGNSGDTERVKGITRRSNAYLRPALVESSWVIIRKDPAMLMLYKRYCAKMIPNKAIIKIARHLVSRIRYVWMNQAPYEIGIVG